MRKTFRGIYKGFIPERAITDFAVGRIFKKEELSISDIKLQTYIQKGYIIEQPAIIEQRKGIKKFYRCGRCQNEQQQQFIHFTCAHCETTCTYCRHCITMGRIATCTKLYIWNGPQPKHPKKHVLGWQGNLTALQQQASDEMTTSLLIGKGQQLLHAVCGSGKTEVLFQPIYEALTQRLRVCIATPRTDVVLELFPRFQQAFPNTTIHALYGDAPKQAGFPQLVLATTHQLYRFQSAFDIMIVDEADAFPYTFDEALQIAVRKAKKAYAPIALVTATPSKQQLANKKGYSFIPKRYHNHPLPVPQFSALWGYEKRIYKQQLPTKLLDWTTQRLQAKEPFLIFFPTINLMEMALPMFQQLHTQILSVHAEDGGRKEKVLLLRDEKIPGLLTTTILERGITIKNVQVAVVGAESPIFTSSALIQISGRVGRNKDNPTGDVTFFHHGITYAMDQAKKEIEQLNVQGFGK